MQRDRNLVCPPTPGRKEKGVAGREKGRGGEKRQDHFQSCAQPEWQPGFPGRQHLCRHVGLIGICCRQIQTHQGEGGVCTHCWSCDDDGRESIESCWVPWSAGFSECWRHPPVSIHSCYYNRILEAGRHLERLLR